MDGASLAYVVTDPSGTPASKKSTLARLGVPSVSMIEEARAYYGTPASSAGAYTNGLAFQARRDSCTCTGIRVYWDSATATTLKLSLYPGAGGAALATVNVASSSAGYKTGTFSSPVSLTRGTVYIAAVWDGVRQPPAPQAVFGSGGAAYLVQPGTMLRDIWVANWGLYVASDAAPSVVATGYFYLVEPLISG